MGRISRIIKSYLSRPEDHRRLKKEMVKLARDYILQCERNDQKISRHRNANGYAELLTQYDNEVSTAFAQKVLKQTWEDVAAAGFDKAFFDAALRAEGDLTTKISWEAYCSMARADLI